MSIMADESGPTEDTNFPPSIKKISEAGANELVVDSELLCIFGEQRSVDCHSVRKRKNYKFRMFKCDLGKSI